VNDRLLQTSASAGGAVLRGVFTVAARLRPSAKPLHPRGRLTRGTVTRTGLTEPVGTPWLDEPGSDEVVVRLSRSVGLPAGLPDILGLAVRIPLAPGRVADLLFSTTGRGRVSRFLLVPRRSRAAGFGTLLPYRTGRGRTVLLAAWPADDTGDRLILGVSGLSGDWHEFGQLVISDESLDTDVSFDPVLNSLPGLDFPDWVTRLREGAYSASRHTRTDGRPDQSLAWPSASASAGANGSGAPNR
jgi:hypothetical protein